MATSDETLVQKLARYPQEVLVTKVQTLELSARTMGCFNRAELTTIEEVIRYHETHLPLGLLGLTNFGWKSFDELQARFEEYQVELSRPTEEPLYRSSRY